MGQTRKGTLTKSWDLLGTAQRPSLGPKGDLAQDLNKFYLRFFSNKILALKNKVNSSGSPPLNGHSMVKYFKQNKDRKSPGSVLLASDSEV